MLGHSGTMFKNGTELIKKKNSEVNWHYIYECPEGSFFVPGHSALEGTCYWLGYTGTKLITVFIQRSLALYLRVPRGAFLCIGSQCHYIQECLEGPCFVPGHSATIPKSAKVPCSATCIYMCMYVRVCVCQVYAHTHTFQTGVCVCVCVCVCMYVC